MSNLREALRDYLQLRHTLVQEGRMLEAFVELLEQGGARRVTCELALKWATLPPPALSLDPPIDGVGSVRR